MQFLKSEQLVCIWDSRDLQEGFADVVRFSFFGGVRMRLCLPTTSSKYKYEKKSINDIDRIDEDCMRNFVDVEKVLTS
jgi:hypothetical protein